MKNIISRFWLLILLVAAGSFIFFSKNLVFADSSQVVISLDANSSQSSGSQKAYDIVLTFTGGSASEKIDYVKTVVAFDKNETTVSSLTLSPENKLGRTLFEESVADANAKGTMTIELGALAAGTGPTTDQKLVIGTIKVESKTANPSFNVSGSQVVNNSSHVISPGTVSSTSSSTGFFSSIMSFIRRLFGLK